MKQLSLKIIKALSRTCTNLITAGVHSIIELNTIFYDSCINSVVFINSRLILICNLLKPLI